jgi:hypothetical protein
MQTLPGHSNLTLLGQELFLKRRVVDKESMALLQNTRSLWCGVVCVFCQNYFPSSRLCFDSCLSEALYSIPNCQTLSTHSDTFCPLSQHVLVTTVSMALCWAQKCSCSQDRASPGRKTVGTPRGTTRSCESLDKLVSALLWIDVLFITGSVC